MQSIKLVSIAGVIFAIGMGIGLGVGVWLDVEDNTPIAEAQIKTGDIPEMQDSYDGYVLPVTVSKSQRALKNFVYEEELPPETINLPTLPVKQALPQKIEPINDTDLAEEEVEADPQPIELSAIPPKPTLLEEAAPIPLWQRRAVKVDNPDGKPMIAIVIDDVGIDQKRSKAAIALPGPLTLAFIPYGYNLQDLVNMTRGNGHEVMLHLPMEPQNPSVNPGPNALLTSLSPEEILTRIEWGFSQFGDYVGVNNHMGSRFTAWEPGMRLVLEQVKKRDLLFMDSITSRDTVGFKMAEEMGIPNTIRDIFLDHDIDEANISKQLVQVEKVAKDKGYAIAIGHPHDETVKVLSKWLVDVENRGFILVPVSAIVRHNLSEIETASG